MRLKRFAGNRSSGHLVSWRHSTSGCTARRNRATRLMRSRTELMFQVVTVRRTGSSGTGSAGLLRAAVERPVADAEQAGVGLLVGVDIVDPDGGVVALRIGHGPLQQLKILG